MMNHMIRLTCARQRPFYPFQLSMCRFQFIQQSLFLRIIRHQHNAAIHYLCNKEIKWKLPHTLLGDLITIRLIITG